MGQLNFTTGWVIETCCRKNCLCQFAIPTGMYDSLIASRNWFFCPNGHEQRYNGPSECERRVIEAERQREVAERQVANLKQECRRAEYRARHYKGELTKKAKKRPNPR